MADRSVAGSNTFETFRTTFNSLSADVGDIACITGASGTIASATDVIEAVVALNSAIFNPASNISFSGNNSHSGTETFTGTVNLNGTNNAAGLTLSSGSLTFADGTSQTTAATTQGFAIAVAVALG